MLGLGLVGPSATFFSNTSSPAATTEFLNGQTTANPPPLVATSELPEQGTADASFLTATLNQIRTEQPTLLAPLPSGVTDVRFYRVFVDGAITGIHLEAASVAPPPRNERQLRRVERDEIDQGTNHRPLQRRHGFIGLWQRPLGVVL